MLINNNAIGVFDSGLGGLTVVKELISLLPNENIIYFGDKKRVPYGSLNNQIIKRYIEQDINFLISKKVKIILIACGTASSIFLNEKFNYNSSSLILDIITPICDYAVKITKNLKIGIIGTIFTIKSLVFEKKIKLLNKNIEIFSQSCPLLVPIIEYKLDNIDYNTLKKILKKYLLPLKEKNIDTLILGCTHYPILIEIINEILENKIKIINPGIPVANYIAKYLNNNNLQNLSNFKGEISFYVSGYNNEFNIFASNFFKNKFYCKSININKY